MYEHFQLIDSEIDLVSGAHGQSNSSSVSQSASATNNGAITVNGNAVGGTLTVVGASAANSATVTQSNFQGYYPFF